jgi:hypothetical protein
MNQKKIIVIAIIFIATTISFGVIFCASGTRTTNNMGDKNNWKTFTNRVDGYSIEYPRDLTPYKYDHTIAFKKTRDDHAIFAVNVWNVNEIPPQIIDEKNYVIEKNIYIGKYLGIITHARGRTEEYINEKTLFVRKDDKYYIVSGGDLDFDFEKLWASFRI